MSGYAGSRMQSVDALRSDNGLRLIPVLIYVLDSVKRIPPDPKLLKRQRNLADFPSAGN